jgi:hypothetical protein
VPAIFCFDTEKGSKRLVKTNNFGEKKGLKKMITCSKIGLNEKQRLRIVKKCFVGEEI